MNIRIQGTAPSEVTDRLVLAIDPGLRDSFGYCIAKLVDMELESEFQVLEKGTLNAKEMSPDEIADTIEAAAEKFGTKKLFIERFRFYTGVANPAHAGANGATVVRMTEIIFFLKGWFRRSGYDVILETPNIWKKKVAPEGKEVLAKKLIRLGAQFENTKVSKVDTHWLDALGMCCRMFQLEFANKDTTELSFCVPKAIKEPKKRKSKEPTESKRPKTSRKSKTQQEATNNGE